MARMWRKIRLSDEFDLLDRKTLTGILDDALGKARLEAPIATGRLRKSIKYRVHSNTNIDIYIDESMYGDSFYPEILTSEPLSNGSMYMGSHKNPDKNFAYWMNVISVFQEVIETKSIKTISSKIRENTRNKVAGTNNAILKAKYLRESDDTLSLLTSSTLTSIIDGSHIIKDITKGLI